MNTCELTHRQEQVANYCREFLAENDQFPTTRLIQSHFEFASQTGAMAHLRALERKGVIERNACKNYRFVRGKEGSELSAEELVTRAVRNAHGLTCGPRWGAVTGAFGLGSTYAIELCKATGFDPHEPVIGTECGCQDCINAGRAEMEDGE